MDSPTTPTPSPRHRPRPRTEYVFGFDEREFESPRRPPPIPPCTTPTPNRTVRPNTNGKTLRTPTSAWKPLSTPRTSAVSSSSPTSTTRTRTLTRTSGFMIGGSATPPSPVSPVIGTTSTSHGHGHVRGRYRPRDRSVSVGGTPTRMLGLGMDLDVSTTPSTFERTTPTPMIRRRPSIRPIRPVSISDHVSDGMLMAIGPSPPITTTLTATATPLSDPTLANTTTRPLLVRSGNVRPRSTRGRTSVRGGDSDVSDTDAGGIAPRSVGIPSVRPRSRSNSISNSPSSPGLTRRMRLLPISPTTTTAVSMGRDHVDNIISVSSSSESSTSFSSSSLSTCGETCCSSTSWDSKLGTNTTAAVLSPPPPKSEFEFGLGPGPPTGWTETADSDSEMITLRTNPHLRTTPLPTPCPWPLHGHAPVGSSTTPLIVTTRRVASGHHRAGYERVVVDYTVPDVGFDTGVRLDLRLGVGGTKCDERVDDVYAYARRDRKRLQSWASLVDKGALEGIPPVERKRQEASPFFFTHCWMFFFC